MLKIGLISDTHSYLDGRVLEYFSEVDEVWHAGDIGEIAVLEQLQAFKPTIAVFGNIDGGKLRSMCNETEAFQREKLSILMTHIANKPPRYNPTVRAEIQKHSTDLLICGHSHILKVERDPTHNLIFMNPGAAGRHGFHKTRTLIRFEIDADKIKHLEVIELGPRSERFKVE